MTGEGSTVRLAVLERVLEANDEVAAQSRGELERRGIFAVDLIGGPGAGKTSLLEATLRTLAERVRAARGGLRAAVVVGDLATQRDGERLARWCDQVVQVATGEGCHLEAGQVRSALRQIDLERIDVLFVENVGNLICPVGFDLGQAAMVGLFSLTEGDDKAAKHPYLVKEADLLLLNKADLAAYLTFDRARFEADVRQLNPTVPLLDVSATAGTGLETWLDWLEEGVARTREGAGF